MIPTDLVDDHGLKRSLPPVVDQNTRVLILGSLPGEASLARREYYANPRNQFWRLMEGLTGCSLIDLAYEARLTRLLGVGVGLWDVIRVARRTGSLDAKIQAHEPHDLNGFCEQLPSLRALAFNGGKAAKIGMLQFQSGAGAPALMTLPSSSPAHAIPFDRKLDGWLQLRRWL